MFIFYKILVEYNVNSNYLIPQAKEKMQKNVCQANPSGNDVIIIADYGNLREIYIAIDLSMVEKAMYDHLPKIYLGNVTDNVAFNADEQDDKVEMLECEPLIFAEKMLDRFFSLTNDDITKLNFAKEMYQKFSKAENLPSEITEVLSIIFEEYNDNELLNSNASSLQGNEIEADELESKIKSVIGEINELVGAEEFKEYINQLEDMRTVLSKWTSGGKYPAQHFLFAINSGDGVSYTLDLLLKYVNATGLYNNSADIYDSGIILNELVFTYNSSISVDMKNECSRITDEIESNKTGLYAIHIDDWIEMLDSSHFKRLIKYCANKRKTNIFVFVVPYLEEQVLKRVYRSINDLLNIKVIRFEPYTDEEMLVTAKKYLNRFNMIIDNNAEQSFRRLLALERRDQRFYGIKTVQKLCTSLILAKAKKVAFKQDDSQLELINTSDFDTLLNNGYSSNEITGYELLDSMIGIEHIKKRVKEIVAAIKAEKHLCDDGIINKPPCYHMLFTGSPGTGKTQVARIIGQIFRENDLLPIGDILEVGRMDMVGEYIGQTGPKTIALCRSAIGSVMFIDEAYMLAAGNDEGKGKDFGAEALGALIAQMENNRDKFVVILAGYENEMDKLYKLNPGLRDRVPHKLHFNNYSRDELFLIFKSIINEQYEADEKLIERAKSFFNGLNDNFINSPNFGNARFVRNLIERIRIKALLRRNGEPLNETKRLELIEIDFESAIADKDMSMLNLKEQKRVLGFKLIN